MSFFVEELNQCMWLKLQLDIAKQHRGERVEDGTAQRDRPLFEVIIFFLLSNFLALCLINVKLNKLGEGLVVECKWKNYVFSALRRMRILSSFRRVLFMSRIDARLSEYQSSRLGQLPILCITTSNVI